MKIKNITQKNNGIALLFSIMLSAIFLSIAMGVLTVATKELNFSSSAKDTNNAFFAADSGTECALYSDRADINAFMNIGDNVFSCFGMSLNLNNNFPDYSFVIGGLGSNARSCVKVSVLKTIDPKDPTVALSTKIISKGYNIGDENCDSSNGNRVERVIEVNY
ncbi:MAG: hypothetical protein WCI93_01275 [bacterium]